jgi:hypothetical protein
MKIWFQKNYKLVITLAFLVPIITVAIVSISHVTRWYGITNPLSWAIYLSVGIEIAALSSLAAISVDMGKKVYFPFGVATLIQFIGNVFFAYSFIDTGGDMFKSWVELSSPLISLFGVDALDIIANKRFLAFFAGGMLPVISLSFLHMLIRFTEEENKKKLIENNNLTDDILPDVPPLNLLEIDITEEDINCGFKDLGNNKYINVPPDGNIYFIPPKFAPISDQSEPYVPTEEELKKLEKILTTKPNDSIKDDMDVDYGDYPDELEELDNEAEKHRDIDEADLDEEIEALIPEEKSTNIWENHPLLDGLVGNIKDNTGDLFKSEESYVIKDEPVEESLWKQVMKKHQERIDNGEMFEDEPTALANSGRTQMLDDLGFLLPVEAELIEKNPEIKIEKEYFLETDSNKFPEIDVLPEVVEDVEDKKKILDPSNEEEINTLPINEDLSSLKSDKLASIIDHKIY